MKITNIFHNFSEMNVYIDYEVIQKWCIMMDLRFLKELMLIRQAKKSVIFATIGIF